MLEPGATVDIDGSAGGGGRLPEEIQPSEAAQPAGLRKSGGFCGAELSIPSSGRASPSLRWGWTKNKQKHKLNHVPRLTHGLDQKSEPGHLHNPVSFMSENTMLYALYRMGYHSRTTGHGFRSTASTILNENGFRPDVIERQLAHCERNKVRAAYNHAQYLPERRKMMQWWADYIDGVTPKTKRRG